MKLFKRITFVRSKICQTPCVFRDSSVAEIHPSLETMEITELSNDGYKNIDELLKNIGARGRFQWLLIATMLLFHVPGDHLCL